MHRDHRPSAARVSRLGLDRLHQPVGVERLDVLNDDPVERSARSRASS